MKLTKTRVKLNEIDLQDRFFCYSDSRYDKEALLKSVSLHGILNPIVLLKRKNKYQIVTGFRRLEIAQELNLKSIPAYLASSKTSLEELFKFSILENQTTRTFNLFEKATLLLQLNQAKIPKRKVIDLFMPLIGLPPSPQKMDELTTLTELPKSLVDYILSKNLSARKFKHLKGLSKNSLVFFADIVNCLAPSANLFEEITREIVEAAKRDDVSVNKVVCSHGLAQIIKDGSIEKAKRLQMLREKAFTLRYPILAGENRKLADELKALGLTTCLDIKWDKSLEEKGVQIKFTVKNKEGLDKSLSCLKELKSSKVLKKFI